MAKRSKPDRRRTKRSVKDPDTVSGEIEEQEATVSEQVEEEPTEVTLRSRVPARLKINGPVSGTLYIFPQAGSEVKVAAEDVPGMLAREMVKGPCCGGIVGENRAFELAEA